MLADSNEYDVIVVGGRAAGATLAARLGQAGVRVLLIERAAQPSLPGMSMPIIYASTMALLDEIGAQEADYARGTPPIRRMINHMPDMQAALPIPAGYGRDYGYAIDRARFDHALWQTAASAPGVTVRDQYSLIDLLWDEDRVVGIVGQPVGGVRESIRAGLVVGADGRFSAVARKAKAQEFDVHDENPTSLYYAYWQGVPRYDDQGAAAVAYGDGSGYGYLVMDSADDTVAVGIEGRTELLEPEPGQTTEFYLDMLRRCEPLWQRVRQGEMITDVRGIRKIGNFYRQPGGQGWALVGDAYHQKDPLDGQGVYDAVYTAKLLSQAIIDYRGGQKTWEQALVWYDTTAREETFPMYQSTLERVRTSLYSTTPEWFSKIANRTFFRWLIEDPLCQDQMGRVLTRQLPADQMMSPPIVVGAMLRGPLRDLSRFLDRQIQEG